MSSQCSAEEAPSPERGGRGQIGGESRWGLSTFALLLLSTCQVGGELIEVPPLEPRKNDVGEYVFTCRDESSVACENNVHMTCHPAGEFLQIEEENCADSGKVCNVARGCITCAAGSLRCQACEFGDADCDRNVVQRCHDSGESWNDVEQCDLPAGDFCFQGACVNMCKRAEDDRSYVGCEFYAADLDNAAIDDVNNASGQQFAVAVANPHPVVIEVYVERNDAPYGMAAEVVEVDRVKVPPGALEVFALERREVDGSSATGLNDGTHSALSSNAYRIGSSHPIIAYQFNPLENTNVFSNDASLLLPTSAVGDRYTVVGWPQTIGDSDNPDEDFDPISSDEDLRAFLTIIGTRERTEVEVTMGPEVRQVVGAEGIPASGPGDRIRLLLGPFDVLNLETDGFNADFTGTVVDSSGPVSVFVGSEASDVPSFGNYATRQCCADHLEEQLFPDATLGNLFSIARMPPRTTALRDAAFEGEPLDIAVVDESEWVRVIAVAPGETTIETSLPFPEDYFVLAQGQDTIIEARQDFLIHASQRIGVLQALPSQGVTGIPRQYPGGDPAIIAVPPIRQYRRDYILLTPDKYAFDFLTITAQAGTEILLDGAPLPDHCTLSEIPPIEGMGSAGLADRVVHRCQLSFPKVPEGENSRPLAGDQNDGVHTLVADREVGVIVYGFDRFVSYAYAGGLNLQVVD
ncbi:MAG: IgGFc-binding protein [Myxococcales bacterium]|nr:IgGFc-binding protein [Myxococcales bacterium]